jgi:hypothetical protein
MVSAKNVPVVAAKSAAAAFLGLDEQVLRVQPLPYKTMHLFAIDGGGFILMSADDRVRPVLGYSMSAEWRTQNGELPSNLGWWLDGYDLQIRAAMENEALPRHQEWLQRPKAVYDTNVGPLLTTLWGQSPYYNALCPDSAGTGELALTGCVATAMGQLMKYWNWPDTGVGEHSYTDANFGMLSADFGATAYDWSHMSISLTAVSSSVEVNAVATLLRHCGVAVNMNYGTQGSGANDITTEGNLTLPCAENAFRTYFKYSPALKGLSCSEYSEEEWKTILKGELDKGRPTMYGGVDFSVGHEFVCDGYDTNGLFSFNWGWQGWCNGFFSIDNLNPDGNSFNHFNIAIVGIEPDTLYGSGASCTVTAMSANPAQGTVAGSGTYTYRDTVALTAQPSEGYRFKYWSNADGTFLCNESPYIFLAHDVELTAIFEELPMGTDDTLCYICEQGTPPGALMPISDSYRFGTYFPVEMLQGRPYLTHVEVVTPTSATITLRIYQGGEEAPERFVYEQSLTPESGMMGWNTIRLNRSLPIAQDSSLWVTFQLTGSTLLTGQAQTSIANDNWLSFDGGETWGHLPDLYQYFLMAEPTTSWYLRCVTAQEPLEPIGIEPAPLSASDLQLRPNPASDIVTIAVDQPSTVRVMDLQGRTVAQFDVQAPHCDFDISHLASGTYIVQAVSPEKVSVNKLIVKRQ